MADTQPTDSYSVMGGNFVAAGEVAGKIKAVLKECGIDPALARRIAIAVFEAEMNIIAYADEGTIEFTIAADEIFFRAVDRGRGIEDIEKAMEEGYSTAPPAVREMGFGAGIGLPNIKKNADWMKLESSPGVGTTLVAGFKLVDA